MTSKRGDNDFMELVKPGGPQPAQPPRLLALIQQHLLVHCERTLNATFLACDDALYDTSQRATNNNEENLYFEAMRKVRIAKQGIQQRFIQNLNDSFIRFAAGKTAPAAQPAAEFSAANLSLVDGDQLEIDLALKNMVSRARSIHQESLFELNSRLDCLLHRRFESQESPLDPESIAHAFIDACSTGLELPLKARLVILKLFEEHTLKQLAPVYNHANSCLEEAGILPDTSRKVAKSEHKSAAKLSAPDASDVGAEAQKPRSPSSANATAPSHQQRFNMDLDTLVSLMASARRLPTDAVAAGGGARINCYIFTGDNPGPVMTAPQLSGLLSRAQLLADRQLAKGPRNIVPQLVDKLLRRADADAPQALKEADEAVINLVSLFFDQILADDNLPLAVYALICRLQIPILKTALQDSSFFSRPDHPARELINTMTEAGVGIDERRSLERDPVYRKMADLVQTLTHEPKVSEPAFHRAHQELRALMRAEKRRFALVERRTNQSAAGRARIRNAKRYAQNLLYSKLYKALLPEAISEFLTTTWMQVLIITHLKHGHDSEEWHMNADIVDDLVWLCQPHTDVRSLQRRERLQPLLLERLQDGLEAAIECPEVRSAKVNELRQALEAVENGLETIDCRELSLQQREILGQRVAQTQPVQPKQQDAAQVSSQFLDRARNLPEGTWIEYKDATTGAPVRYRLAIKSDPEAYVFVNRLGFRTMERSCKQLALDLESGRAKPLPGSEFFDRMMNKVLSRISSAA